MITGESNTCTAIGEGANRSTRGRVRSPDEPMKRVFHHPPEPSTGKHYWRGLGELNNTPEFRQWLEREFPAGAAELNGDEWSDRKSTRLNSSHVAISYAVFCLKKKNV